MIGEKIGRLTVVSFNSVRNKNSHYNCECECGNTTVVSRPNLRNNHTNSCGCLSSETISIRSTTHGKSRSKIYNVWNGMIQRCTNEKQTNFLRYGGRGIKVCDEWAKGFDSFYSWAILNGYIEGLTIDRINNDGNYEPSNCRWATMSMQMLNRGQYFIEGRKGVHFEKGRNKWVASLGKKTKRFNTVDEALEQRNIWKNEVIQNRLMAKCH